MNLDPIGYMGAVSQYATAFFFTSSALLFFIYFYRKKKCGFEEESKMEMLKDD